MQMYNMSSLKSLKQNITILAKSEWYETYAILYDNNNKYVN